jgi:hypothetical protein
MCARIMSPPNTFNTLIISSYTDYTRVSTTPSTPSSSSSTNVGRIYVKQIDANNDGLFIKLKKAGAYVEVQIA